MLEVNSYLMAPSEKIGGNNENLPSGRDFLASMKDAVSTGIASVTGDARSAVTVLGLALAGGALASEMPEPTFEEGIPVPGLVEKPDGASQALHGLSFDNRPIYSHTLGLDRSMFIDGVGEVSVPEGYVISHVSAHNETELRYKDIADTGDIIAFTLEAGEGEGSLVDPRVVYTVDQQRALLEDLVGVSIHFKDYASKTMPDGKVRELITYTPNPDLDEDVDLLLIERYENEGGEIVVNVLKQVDNEGWSNDPSISGDAFAFFETIEDKVYVSNGGEPVEVDGRMINPAIDAENGLLYYEDPDTENIMFRSVAVEAPQVVGDILIEGVGTAYDSSTGMTNHLEEGEYTVTIPFKDNLGGTNIVRSGLYEFNPDSGQFDIQMPAAIDTTVTVDEDGVSHASFTFYMPDNDVCRFVVVAGDDQDVEDETSMDISTVGEDTGTEPPIEEPDLYVHNETQAVEGVGEITATGAAYVDLDPTTTPSDSDAMVGLTTENPEDVELTGDAEFSNLVDGFSAGLDTEGAAARVDFIEGDGFKVKMTYGVGEVGKEGRAVPFTDFEITAVGDIIFYYDNEMLEMSDGEVASLADFKEETKNPNVRKAPVDERPSGCSVVPGTSGLLAILPAALLTRRRRRQ